MPVSSEVITDPEEARQVQASQNALRIALFGSVFLDFILAVVLIVMGFPVVIVAIVVLVMAGIGIFMIRRVMKANESRLANFRDPVSGQIQIP